MCFSAAASITAGVGLSLVGAACLTQVRSVRQVPFAIIPILFGAQQLAESGVWFALTRGDDAGCYATGFSAFAQVLWPIYAPLAVLLIEPAAWRRRAMLVCALAGLVVGLSLLYGLIWRPVTPLLVDGHIFYRSTHFDALYNAGLFVPATALYVTATCGSLLLASDRIVALMGAAMAAAFAVTYVFYETWLISVWCFFAAALSVLVWLWVRRARLTRPVRTS